MHTHTHYQNFFSPTPLAFDLVTVCGRPVDGGRPVGRSLRVQLKCGKSPLTPFTHENTLGAGAASMTRIFWLLAPGLARQKHGTDVVQKCGLSSLK